MILANKEIIRRNEIAKRRDMGEIVKNDDEYDDDDDDDEEE